MAAGGRGPGATRTFLRASLLCFRGLGCIARLSIDVRTGTHPEPTHPFTLIRVRTAALSRVPCGNRCWTTDGNAGKASREFLSLTPKPQNSSRPRSDSLNAPQGKSQLAAFSGRTLLCGVSTQNAAQLFRKSPELRGDNDSDRK